MIAQAMQKVGNEGVITVEEATSLDTELDIVEGMQFDRGYLSAYFVTNAEKMVAELESPCILLHEKRLSSLQSLRLGSGCPDRPAAADRRRGYRRRGASRRWWSTNCAAASRWRRSRPGLWRPAQSHAR